MSEDFAAAMDVALRQLAASDRFEAEVRAKLARFSPDVVERVLSRLRETRMLNDERATLSAVRGNEGRRAVGVSRLAERLQRRGASAESVADLIRENSGSEAELARAALAGKFRSPKAADRAKAARFLAARGFDEETVAAVVLAAFGDPTDLPPEDVFTE